MQLDTWRLNSGAHFSQPYQSDLAMMRHFLLANRGFPLTTLNTWLAKHADGGGPTIRVRSLLPQKHVMLLPKELAIPQGHAFQCVECAKRLYHTDVFNLPWLTCCPIHHCELVRKCPMCTLPWPDMKTLPHRACRHCGLFSFTPALAEKFDFGKMNGFEGLEKLIAFLTDKPSNSMDFQGDLSTRDHSVFSPIGVAHPMFPIVQSHRSTLMTIAELHAMGVKKHKCIKKKCFACTPSTIEKVNNIPSAQHSESSTQAHINDFQEHFKAMISILSIFSNEDGSPHAVHLYALDQLRTQDLIQSAPICKVCFAMSLWFFHSVCWLENTSMRFGPGKYPFLKPSHSEAFLAILRATALSDRNLTIPIPQEIRSWTLERSLILAFIDTYNIVDGISTELSARSTPSVVESSIARYLDDLDIYVDIRDNVGTIYYARENVLQAVPTKNRVLTLSHCSKFAQHYDRHMDENMAFHKKIDHTTFKYDDYLSLKRDFLSMCRNRIGEYLIHSSPMREYHYKGPSV